MLGFDLLKSGIFSVLPWITMAIFANLGGWLADTMVSRGVSITTVRKIMQTVRTQTPCNVLIRQGITAILPPLAVAGPKQTSYHVCRWVLLSLSLFLWNRVDDVM